MQVVVAGASGFVGQEVVRQALTQGLEVFPLVRERDLPVFLEAEREGAITPLPWGADPEVLRDGFGLQPGALLINAAGLPKERPGQDPHRVHEAIAREVVRLAEGLQVRRLVHIGPLILPTRDAYLHSKQVAEGIIAKAQVPWSILRSAPAYGPGDEFLDELGAWMVRSPILPRFLEEVSLDPLWVGDLASAALAAEPGDQEVGGDRTRWGDLLSRAARAAGKKWLGPRLSDETVLRLTRSLGDRGLLMGLVPFTGAGFRRHQQGYAVERNALPGLLGRPARPLEDYLRHEWPYRHEPSLSRAEAAGHPSGGGNPEP